jgi:membrane-anchored protein YejM (alkaline phosphatase superfamily)
MQKFEFYFDKFLSQKVEKEVKFLFISYLFYLEELMNKGAISESEYQAKRKEILDRGNAAIRNIDEQINSIFSNLQIV